MNFHEQGKQTFELINQIFNPILLRFSQNKQMLAHNKQILAQSKQSFEPNKQTSAQNYQNFQQLRPIKICALFIFVRPTKICAFHFWKVISI